ncbi:MAG: hypothetical protein ACI9XR_001755 [Flavobacterium sp.]|jgi:hypothetical protein
MYTVTYTIIKFLFDVTQLPSELFIWNNTKPKYTIFLRIKGNKNEYCI